MRYRRRLKRPYRPRGKYFFSDREIDYTADNFPYERFLLKEFFSADQETLNKFWSAYRGCHGERAFDYLYRKYDDWREGHFHLTDMIRERILSMMPRYISVQGLNDIGLFEFSRGIKSIVRDHDRNRLRKYVNKEKLISVGEWAKRVEDEHVVIEALEAWPHRYLPLPEAEAQDALEVAQYILRLKLSSSATRVVRDLTIIRPRLAELFAHGCTVSYRTADYGVEIDLLEVMETEVPETSIEVCDITEDSRYREYAEKYFAYELTTLHGHDKKAQGNAITFAEDLKLFIRQVNELIQGSSIMSVKQNMIGEGGILHIQVNVYPQKLAKVNLVKSLCYLFSLALFTVLLVTVLVKTGVWVFAFFVGVFTLPWLAKFIGTHLAQIKQARRSLLRP